MSETETAKPKTELPRYRVLEKCYLPIHGKLGVMEQILDPEAMPYAKADNGEMGEERVPLIVTFTGVPAPYLEPVNKAAREMCEKHKARMTPRDALMEMTQISAAT